MCWTGTKSNEKRKTIVDEPTCLVHKEDVCGEGRLTVASGQGLEARHWFAGVVMAVVLQQKKGSSS